MDVRLTSWFRGKGAGRRVRGSRQIGLTVVLLAGTVTVVAAPPAAATRAPANAPIAVTTTADVVDPDDGVVSLREAVDLANAQPGDDTIDLAADATYAISLGCAVPEDANAGGDLDHTDPTGGLEVDGSVRGYREFYPATAIAVDPACPARVIHALGDGTLDLHGVIMTGGHPGPDDARGDGGGVRGAATVVLSTADLRSNHATGRGGGVAAPVVRLYNAGLSENVASSSFAGPVGGAAWALDVTASGSDVGDNRVEGAEALGGGIAAMDTARLSDSSVYRNRAAGGGGGVAAPRVEVDGRSWVNHNEAVGPASPGGGLLAWAVTEESNASVVVRGGSTVAYNRATGGGGGIVAPLALVESSAVYENEAVDLGGTRWPELGGGGVAAEIAFLVAASVADNVVRASVPGGIAHGGGISANSADVERSSVTDNAATGPGVGGGVYAWSVSTSSATVADNEVGAGGRGGGIGVWDDGGVGLDLSTVTGNWAPVASNIDAPGGSARMSIIGEPRGGGQNCTGPVLDSETFNVVGAGGGCGLHGRGDRRQVSDLQLGWLGSGNGQFYPALSRRPLGHALSVIPLRQCPGLQDARGRQRPRGPRCEAGAVEIR